MELISEDCLTLSKLKSKVAATRFMLTKSFDDSGVSKEREEEQIAESKERVAQIMDVGFSSEDELENTPMRLVGTAVYLQVQTKGESGVENCSDAIGICTPNETENTPMQIISKGNGEGFVATEAQQRESSKSVKESNKLQCTQGARQNAQEEFQLSNDNGNAVLFPVSLLKDIEASGVSKPVSNMENLDVEKATNEYIENLNNASKEKLKSCLEDTSDSINAASKDECAISPSYATIVKGKFDTKSVSRDTKEYPIKEIDSTSSTRPSSMSDLKLRYFVHNSGTPVHDLIPDNVAMERWSKCLVGYFVGTKLPFYEVKKVVFKQWLDLGIKNMTCTENGFYFFEFHDVNAIEGILDKGHCHIFGRVMVIKRWHQMLNLTKEARDKVPVWVKLYGLPFEFWSSDNLSKVASRLGNPLYVDQATEKMTRVSYARVCIEIDALEELQNTIQIGYGGEIVDVMVKYQWVPNRCTSCKIFGHNVTSCPLRPKVNGIRFQESADAYSAQNITLDNNKWQQPGVGNHKWRHVQGTSIGSSLGARTFGFGFEDERVNGAHNITEAFEPKKFGNTKLVDRNGNVRSINEVKKSVRVANESSLLKTGDSFELIANLEDVGLVKGIVSKKEKEATVVLTKSRDSHIVSKQDEVVNFSSVAGTSMSNDVGDGVKEDKKEDLIVEDRVDNIEPGTSAYVGDLNSETDTSLFEAFQGRKGKGTGDDDAALCTPNAKVGGIFSDYRGMSKKKAKKVIKAAKFASMSKKDPP